MRKIFILKIMLISLAVILMFVTNAYCVEDDDSLRMKIDNTGTWTNITIGEAYEECIELNSGNSTLNTENLEAHLTTSYDWNAMAMFSASQYGGMESGTSAKPTYTNRKQNRGLCYES